MKKILSFKAISMETKLLVKTITQKWTNFMKWERFFSEGQACAKETLFQSMLLVSMISQ